MKDRPQLWVFAGPNGAGKSTLAERFMKDRLPIVNPDVIARDLPRKPDGRLAEAEAGRQAIEQRSAYIAAGQSFAFETTLSGASELRAMQAALNAGYKVNLVFVGLDATVLSQGRVGERVAKGGHDVPADAIERRYRRAMEALPKAAVLAERVILFDNSGSSHKLVLVYEDGQARHHASLPGWAARALGDLPAFLNGKTD